MKRDCPKVKENKVVLRNLNVVNAWDVALNNLVQGMITMEEILAILLFDSRCANSYISYNIVRNLNLKPKMHEPSLIDSTSNWSKTIVDKYVNSIIMEFKREVNSVGLNNVSFGGSWCDSRDGLVVQESCHHRL